MSRPDSRFQQSYRRHLLAEQRREILRTLRDSIDPGTTLGEVVDAAEALGWGEPMGDMSLGEIAEGLLGEKARLEPIFKLAEAARPAIVEADEDEDEEPEAVAVAAVAKKAGKKATKKASAKKVAKKAAAKPAPAKSGSGRAVATAKSAPAKPTAKAAPSKPAAKKASKKAPAAKKASKKPARGR